MGVGVKVNGDLIGAVAFDELNLRIGSQGGFKNKDQEERTDEDPI